MTDIPLHLIDSAQSCNPEAEKELIQLLHARILALGQRRLWRRRGKRGIDAEDLSQDALMVLVSEDEEVGKKKYKTIERDRFIPYVMQIVRNKIGDDIRCRRRSRETSLEESAVKRSKVSSEKTYIDNQVLDDTILTALHSLDPKCRKIIRALICQSKGHELPEEFRNMPREKWYVLKSRCLKKFRKELRKRGWNS